MKTTRTYSRYTLEALHLFGQLIRAGRIERKLTAQALAERIGVSRALIQRIEDGDPSCGIGTVFEAAAITQVPLFDVDKGRMTMHIRQVADKLSLLPKTAHKSSKAVIDDF